VIGISGSGNSRNVLLAFEEAKKRGATTICYSGFQGGKARAIADVNIIVPCQKMVQVEDIHLIINHMVADELKRLVQNRQELKG
jgi:D-sedoheptulose 7-phosphate isomerase